MKKSPHLKDLILAEANRQNYPKKIHILESKKISREFKVLQKQIYKVASDPIFWLDHFNFQSKEIQNLKENIKMNKKQFYLIKGYKNLYFYPLEMQKKHDSGIYQDWLKYIKSK